MKVVSKKIEMMVYFKKDGRINSIKFKIEEDSKCGNKNSKDYKHRVRKIMW